MSLSVVASVTSLLLFPGLMIWAGMRDVLTMSISNRLVLGLLAGYAVLAPASGLELNHIAWSAAVAAVVFFVAFAFFALGWIGGGDAKLVTVAALWLGAEQVPAFIVYTTLLGGGLALCLLLFRRLPLPPSGFRFPWIARLHGSGAGVPYGVALAAAALLVFPDSAWMRAPQP